MYSAATNERAARVRVDEDVKQARHLRTTAHRLLETTRLLHEDFIRTVGESRNNRLVLRARRLRLDR